ncbi:MAG TPA: chitobiase/beta-hexosaminidase C-terminal domain-containing protein [Acidobacteriaceae bacterium]|nr:chitobiase/beta-hexosaminidase C-terminal domain-containing protein [Acidobacteriaceae bacterium]
MRPVHIDMDQTAIQTICANATSLNFPPSNTTCNHYDSGKPGDLAFSYADGQVTMSTSLPGAAIFYTIDGSTATEGSIEYTGLFLLMEALQSTP